MSKSRPNRKKNQYTYNYNRQIPGGYDDYDDTSYGNRPSWMDERDEEIDKFEYSTKKKVVIKARNNNQQILIDLLEDKDEDGNPVNQMIYVIGSAGCGKTFLAVAEGIKKLQNKEVKKIILVRPAVETGRGLGFLPGNLEEKMDPYLRPLYDELEHFYTKEQIQKMVKDGVIEIAPLNFMRGRNFLDCYVILDESQNCSHEEMKMFVTRIGQGSVFVITGDPHQSDLPEDMRGAFVDYSQKFGEIDGIAVCRFSKADIVRHPLVARMVEIGLD